MQKRLERFFQPRRNDPDNAGMPASACGPDEGALHPAALGLRDRRLAQTILNLAAISVQLVQPCGQRFFLVPFRGGEQPRAQIRSANPATRVNPWP